jgi:histone H3/H4
MVRNIRYPTPRVFSWSQSSANTVLQSMRECASCPFASSSLSLLTQLHLTPVFISEITARAFIVADSNKRRTLSRQDIAKALAKSDQFDFLIDIVPRDDGQSAGQAHAAGQAPGANTGATAGAGPGPGYEQARKKRKDVRFRLPCARSPVY